MVIAFVGNGLHIRLGKRNLSHDRTSIPLVDLPVLSVKSFHEYNL
jgi:hypothetical protein